MLACSNIPLGIACSGLAGVPGINGLYTILLASFTYPIFSAWPHGTLGPYAPIDISTGVHTHIILQQYYATIGGNSTSDDVVGIVNPSTVTSTLVFMNGCICVSVF
jgi:MFS superfamily sulfate permease-like transporter